MKVLCRSGEKNDKHDGSDSISKIKKERKNGLELSFNFK